MELRGTDFIFGMSTQNYNKDITTLTLGRSCPRTTSKRTEEEDLMFPAHTADKTCKDDI